MTDGSVSPMTPHDPRPPQLSGPRPDERDPMGLVYHKRLKAAAKLQDRGVDWFFVPALM